MTKFVFSCDAHIVEPRTLFADQMPASLKGFVPNAYKDDRYMMMRIGERVVHRTPLAGSLERPSKGAGDLNLRREDMEADGVDAEILFPTLGLLVYFIADPDAELAAARIYNDWCIAQVAGKRDVFVPTAILPVRDLKNTVSELKRIAGLGFTAAMIPVVAPGGGEVPLFNSEAWDPVFALAAELGVVFTLHTGTGQSSWVVERGPGAAVINYTRQMNDACSAVMYMVSGGLLDRHPTAQVAFVESGASWLAGVCERMDEVYHAHNYFVRPKLSLLPSEIVRRQVKATFQTDRACIMSRSVTGHETLMWGADYPHAEGTYPHSKNVVGKLFDGIEISEREKADILGGTAARLFKLQRPEFAPAKAA